MNLLTTVKAALTKMAGITFWNWFQLVVTVFLTTYIFVAFQVPHRNAEEIRELRAELERVEHVYIALSDSLQLRIQALESTTYVDVLAELKKQGAKSGSVALERWEKNRAAVIDKRLDTLEKWRYSVDGKLP